AFMILESNDDKQKQESPISHISINSYRRYLDIIHGMGKTSVALDEIYCKLFDGEDDLNSHELHRIVKNFSDYSIDFKIAQHPKVKARTLKLILIKNGALENAWELENVWKRNPYGFLRDWEWDYKSSCLNWLNRLNRMRAKLNSVNYFFDELVAQYSNLMKITSHNNQSKTLTYICIRKYLFISRRISTKLFNNLTKNDQNNNYFNLILVALENPFLNTKDFYLYQHATNQQLLKSIVSNPKTPTKVLNNVIKNLNKSDLHLVKNHKNSTDFTREMVDKRISQGTI
ncbi:hypothetical protein QUF76_17670, partial [Desulfobacterales bacterium HSG16]|nr:hypothetical protein [Desulfobacterales bacterium HSG16]